MNGHWLRVTPTEWAKAREDPDWAFTLARSAWEDEAWRLCSTDKAWHALDFLLSRRGFGVPLVYGAELLVDLPAGLDVDWGYGPPLVLPPKQVAVAASELAQLTEEDLVRGVEQADLDRADIYPAVWDRPGELDWVTGHLPRAQEFFAAAARDGHAVICWRD
ncbi:YfbM family protein [Plantactinospora sonchi]|uniref:YfbM family protein n=1 Tax=Plantactinospora sonchi TaxID=1544735 RepID=A0ABU7S1P2_9ACTN